MGRKKTCDCYSCGKKGYVDDFIKEDLDDDHQIYFCSTCCREVTSDEVILNEKIYLLFKKILGVKTLNKSIKGYIRNRLSEDFENKRTILFNILKEKSDKLKQIISEKSFPNMTIKCKYIFASVENDIKKEYQRQHEVEKIQTDFDVPIPLMKSVIKKVRDISKYL